MQRSKGLAALLLAVAILIGGALGFMTARVIYPATASAPSRGSQDYWDQIAHEWQLTDTQRAVIDSLLDVQQRKISALYQPLMPKMDSVAVLARAISDTTQMAMRDVLNDGQRRKLDELRKEARQQAEERRARRTDWWRKVQ